MNKYLNKYLKKLIIPALALLIGIAIGFSGSPDPEVITTVEHETITETVVDEASRRELRAAYKENEELKARIKDLNARPVQVITQYIEVPGEQVTLPEVPDDYLYMNEGGLVVAEHHITEDGFVATVHDITIENTLVVSEVGDTSLVHAEATVSTSYDDTELTVLTDTKAVGVREGAKVRFSPLVEVQAMADMDGTYSGAGGAYAGVEYSNKKDIWLGLGVDVSDRQVRPALKVQVRL